MKFRIMQKGNGFYPEVKTLWWWSLIRRDSTNGGPYLYPTCQDAADVIEEYIEMLEEEEEPPRVVWQSDRQTSWED